MVTRKEKNDSQDYQMVRLYLDDLQTIERTLDEISDPANRVVSRQVSNGDWTAESLQDLVDRGEPGPFNNFSIQRSGPGLLSLEVRDHDTRLYVSDLNNLELRGAYDKIDAVVREARRGLPLQVLTSATGATIVFGAPAILGFFGIFTVALDRSGDARVHAIAVCALMRLFGAAGYAIGIRISMNRNGLAYLVNRSERPNFFTRKRDDLWLVLISSVLAAALGVVGTLFLTNK